MPSPFSPPIPYPLEKALAEALPKDFHCTAWHLSTTPAPTPALCYPPALKKFPDAVPPFVETRSSKPLRTYCEKHFLAVSVTDPTSTKDVLALGLEIYIYTTSFSTTIFVAKADSTGYLGLQSTPKGFSSIRAITSAFLGFLVLHRRRPERLLVINLFARAQSQYIFPGSVNNDKKHILDDRGLVRWWCRVLNSLLEYAPPEIEAPYLEYRHGYLVIPGLDDYETRAFIPRTKYSALTWSLGHPLELISPYTKDALNFDYDNISPRCLIPTYPDDPKARFVEELEESTSEKVKLSSGWKTPKTLDQFWEMMAFRQECSSGRMTGFIWLTFEPDPLSTLPRDRDEESPSYASLYPLKPAPSPPPHDPYKSYASLASPLPSRSRPTSTKSLRRKRRAMRVLTGPILHREPRIKTRRGRYPKLVKTPYYSWPEAGRGRVILDDHGYKRAVELLLRLEFRGLEQAIASTSRWTQEVNMGENWSLPVIGELVIPDGPPVSAPLGTVNNLTGSIKKKRKSEDESSNKSAPTPVNMLSDGLVRKKKRKVDDDGGLADVPSTDKKAAELKVTVLGSGSNKKESEAQ
ncbi:hypothetical protein F5B17DRAFT_380194 [Nemania serpens]|nr:hypothetical protein F5B17DRAFT_380194 [Nemania serpens]